VQTALLVGGFAASDWVFSELQWRLAELGITLARPDGHVNKAVADGAVSFYLDHFVSARVAKLSYGVGTSNPFNPNNPEHRKRFHKTFRNVAGLECLSDIFSIILPKVSLLLPLSFQLGLLKCFRAPKCLKYKNIGDHTPCLPKGAHLYITF